MNFSTADVPDGRTIRCVITHKVAISVCEIFTDDLAAEGIDLPADGTYFDVGANMRNVPQVAVFAYEPMTEAFTALRNNLETVAPTDRTVPIALGATQ